MNLLLDTQVFLRFILEPAKLLASFHAAIVDPSNQIYLSPVSLWEIAVKHQLGKLPFAKDPAVLIPEERQRANIRSLPLEEGAIVHLAKLPLIHHDPFDRLLMCQAVHHGMTFVTVDHVIKQYPIPLLK